ncbi:MAG: divergent polysaccharide deacetylase family protein [Candidatus Zixiibacteriota bacterium]
MTAKRKTTSRRTSYRERKPSKKKSTFPFKTAAVLLVIIVLVVLAVSYLDLGEIIDRFLQKEAEGHLIEGASFRISELLANYGAKPERLEFGPAGEQLGFVKKSLPKATAQLPLAYSLLLVQRGLDSALAIDGFSIGEAAMSGDRRRLEIEVQSAQLQPLLGLTVISSPLLSPLPSNLAVVITGLESASDRLRMDFLKLDLPLTLLFDFQNRETLGLLSLVKESHKEVILSLALQEGRFSAAAKWYDFGRRDQKFEDMVARMLERFSFVKGISFAEDSLTAGEGTNLRKAVQEASYRGGYLFALSPRLHQQISELDLGRQVTVYGGETLLQRHLKVSGSLRHRLLVLGDIVVHRRSGIVALEANSETLSALKAIVSDYRKRNLNLVFISQLA